VNVGEGEVSPAQKKAARDALGDIEAASARFHSSIKDIAHPDIHRAHGELNLKVQALRDTLKASTFRAEEP